MRVFDLISLMDPDVRSDNSKIHLATWNGEDDPLDVFRTGEFGEWQRWQTKKNFERTYVISLIAMPETNLWLFAGVYVSKDCSWIEGAAFDHYSGLYRYDLPENKQCAELSGRLVANFERPGRQSYLNAENWVDKIYLAAIYAEPLTIGEFPGFRSVNLSHDELKLIVMRSHDSWRTALANVAGIYLITEQQDGGLYVGAAYGEGGIWQRWVDYAVSGHGGNRELRALLKRSDQDHLKHFRFSILETADLHASKEEILERERHWKNVLGSRTVGLNAN